MLSRFQSNRCTLLPSVEVLLVQIRIYGVAAESVIGRLRAFSDVDFLTRVIDSISIHESRKDDPAELVIYFQCMMLAFVPSTLTLVTTLLLSPIMLNIWY